MMRSVGSCGMLSMIFCSTLILGKVIHKICCSILSHGSQALHIFQAHKLLLGCMTSVAGPVFLASLSSVLLPSSVNVHAGTKNGMSHFSVVCKGKYQILNLFGGFMRTCLLRTS